MQIESIVDHVNESGISNTNILYFWLERKSSFIQSVPLSKSDIEKLLEKLSYENILEQIVDYHDNVCWWQSSMTA